MLREIEHQNIVSLYEIYEDSVHIYMIFEYCKGGELYEKILAKGNYSESDAARLMKKLLEAIAYCHQIQILHRDLKLENIILTYPSFK